MWPTVPYLRTTWFAVVLWLTFFGLALFSLRADSPTMDEQNHLARGAALIRTGDPRLSVEHPPVGNGLSGLMLLLEPDLRLPLDHESWTMTDGWYAFADQFLWFYGVDVTRVIFLGRLAMVFVTMLLSLIGYLLAKRLWGWTSGSPHPGLSSLRSQHPGAWTLCDYRRGWRDGASAGHLSAAPALVGRILVLAALSVGGFWAGDLLGQQTLQPGICADSGSPGAGASPARGMAAIRPEPR